MQTEKLLKTNQDVEEFLFWIATLQSGVVNKAKEYLNGKKGGYCCLGVGIACTVADEYIEKVHKSNRIRGIMPAEQSNSPEWLKNINQYCEENFDVELTLANDGNLECYNKDGFKEIQNWSHKKIADFLLDKFNQDLL